MDDAAGWPGWAALGGRVLRSALARFAPWGAVTANLAKGQVVVLEGAGTARVECLSGNAWVTNPTDGRDIGLSAGQDALLARAGQVAVSAMGGPARVRLRWR